jgi:hypothetical protein
MQYECEPQPCLLLAARCSYATRKELVQWHLGTAPWAGRAATIHTTAISAHHQFFITPANSLLLPWHSAPGLVRGRKRGRRSAVARAGAGTSDWLSRRPKLGLWFRIFNTKKHVTRQR